ncbi:MULTISPECIES: hypothetical protein [unclassified Erwinia]|nr:MULTISPECIES: hypothetical protein [unclassified Erwinia]
MGGMLVQSAWAGDTTALSWTISTGTCSVDSSAFATNLGGADPSSLIGRNWQTVLDKPLILKLTCSSGMTGGGRPVVTVAGAVTDSAAPWLFRDAGTGGGTSKGFGFVLKKLSEAGGNQPDVEVKQGEQLYVPKDPFDPNTMYYGVGEVLNGTYTIPLSAGVACGKTAWCEASKLAAGTVKASVTFTFAYK